MMKSPFTGGKVVLVREESELTFRKEPFRYMHLSYQCVDTGERFTTTDIDEINLLQVYNRYRVKYGIPFPDEIRQLRQMYGLSAAKMSEILGFGNNQYRLYENGDMPSEANGKILGSIRQPEIFRAFVENAGNQFEGKEYAGIVAKLDKAIERNMPDVRERLVFETYGRGEWNGYAPQSYVRLKNVVLYFLQKCGDTFTTKMNKLLFYADFYSYKTRGYGMTGLAYKAIQFGPVPVRWDRVYSLLDDVCTEEVVFPSGNYGTQLCPLSLPDIACFSAADLRVLDQVVFRFKGMSAAGISELSHEEDAWLHYRDSNGMIDFIEAFTLKAL